MLSKMLLLCTAFLYTIALSAQKLNTKSIGIITQNDSYMLMGKDGYYTNGLVLSYNWTSRDSNIHTIHSIEFGQLMYNARNGSYDELWKIDRPITAYLFGQYAQTHFYRDNVIKWSLDLGTIGPNAYGREVQEFIHRTLGMYKPREWKYQLRNALGINGNITYAPLLFKEKTTVNFYPIVSSDFGMSFTNIGVSTLLTIGHKASNHQSMLWHANLNQTDPALFESFFYLRPSLTYNIYNATIQGGISFTDVNRGTLNRYLFKSQLGWQYAHRKSALNLSVTYTGKEAKEQRNTQWYGSLGFFYALK